MGQLKTSEFKMTSAKTRQQLEEERESFFRNTVMRVQEEAAMLSNRAKEDELKRIEYLRSEEERIKREEVLRQEAMLRAEEERKQGTCKTRRIKETANCNGKGKRGDGKAKA